MKGKNESGEKAEITNLFQVNHMLNRIGYDLATKQPGYSGDNQLVYFNAVSSAGEKPYSQNEILSNKSISFSTDQNGVGIAVNKNENEIALLGTKGVTYVFENAEPEDVESAEIGYYDTQNVWHKEDDVTITETDGKVTVTIPEYNCVRIITKENSLDEPQDNADVKIKIEAESAYQLKEGLKANVWTDGASGSGWLKVEANTKGDYVTITADIPRDGIYRVDTCYRQSTGRGKVQLTVDGKSAGSQIDMSGSKTEYVTASIENVALTAGTHELTYTVTESGETGGGYVIPLDYIYLERTATFVDKTNLQKLYDTYKDLEQGIYTDESYEKLQSALKSAKEILDKEASEGEVATQVQLLEDAVSNLLVKTDKDMATLYKELEDLLAQANEEIGKTGIYTEENLQKAKTVIDEVQAFYDGDRDDPALTPERVATELYKLQTALETLKATAGEVPGHVDITELQNVYNANKDKAEEEYTPDSWGIFKEALDAALEVINNSKVDQTAVDTAKANLEAAAENLVRKADKSALQEAIAVATEKQAMVDTYTEQSLNDLKAAVEGAQDVLENSNASQAEVDAQVTALQGAIDGLQEKSEPEKTPASIEIVTLPTITEYISGGVFDPSGLVIKVVYSDGSEENVDKGFEISGYNSEQAGEQTITVAYGGQTTSFQITVKEVSNRLEVPTENGYITVSIPKGSIPEDVTSIKLEVKKMEPEAQEDVTQMFAGIADLLKEMLAVSEIQVNDSNTTVFDIKLINEGNGETVSLNGQVLVTVSKPAECSRNLKIFHQHQNDGLKEISFQWNDKDELVFVTDKFSLYSIVDLGEVNRSSLESALMSAKALNQNEYTVESWNVLQSALTEAEAVQNNQNATQKQVDDAVNALNGAIQALKVVTADKSALGAALEAVKELKQADYTKESWEAVQKILGEAESVYADENATQEQVDIFAADLSRVIEGLKKNSETSQEPGDSQGENLSSSGDSQAGKQSSSGDSQVENQTKPEISQVGKQSSSGDSQAGKQSSLGNSQAGKQTKPKDSQVGKQSSSEDSQEENQMKTEDSKGEKQSSSGNSQEEKQMNSENSKNENQASEENQTSTAQKSGEKTPIVLWLSLALVAVVIILASLIRLRNKR